ncbi:hypothetical protein KAF25_005029 [Fusarium avenaceum]|uniref:Uncharacterized protein n=1 Tax=Fusarium avenaceum TaxID=40199 RepID=A0A9P7KXM8_9HYPO|nr:hypothetical protein KAF25_005029 [Fusarium avenaceum]
MPPHLKRQLYGVERCEDGGPPKKPQILGFNLEASVNVTSLNLRSSSEVSDGMNGICYGGTTEDILSDEIICYGAVCDAQALITPQIELPKPIQPWDRHCLLPVELGNGACYLPTKHGTKPKQRPVLDCHTASTLTFVGEKVVGTSFTAVLETKLLLSQGRKSNSKPLQVGITVNIYGPRSSMDEVDQAISKIESYLQHPVFLEPDVSYINPQYYYPSPERTNLRHLVGPIRENIASSRSREIENVMDHLETPEDISSQSYSIVGLSETLDRFLPHTKLKEHQLQGVEFILGREDAASMSQIHKKMLMAIHHNLMSYAHVPGCGGILADAMGLGKTLTMLSAILCSKELTLSLSKDICSIGDDYKSTASNLTLVVLPSRQLLDVWKNEIDQRFTPDAFRVAIFHGNARVKERSQLLDHDVVLTTYHTMEKDSSSNRVLSSIKWSRIVLDEAHQIRNSSIKQFKAAASLESDSRWCLTGTPIQNTFDDLRSLLQFLRFEPFSQNKVFEEHIIKPFRVDSGDECDTSRNLRIMLKACCLRRTQAKLDLSSTTTEKVSVMPTEDEKALFKRILEQCREEFDIIAGKDGGSKRSNVLFSTIMKLRRVCNHGVIALESTSTKQSNQLAVPKKQRSGSRSPSSEPACEYCTGKDKDDELLGVLDSCPLCGRLLFGGNDEALSMAPSPQSWASPATSMMDLDTPEPTASILDKFSASNELRQQSSKMSAVIDNIKTSCICGDSKSVVFSSWRDTLDILAKMFSADGIEFVQVDGRNPLTGRTELLSRFRQDADVRVLLISINTGAVGLTLTEANMVHIVEPQWNPTIEDQAIARVVRMGQNRPVTVFKYITAGSVEHTVVKLQEKKTRIIKLSMQDKDDAADTNLDNFKFAIDPNEWGATV